MTLGTRFFTILVAFLFLGNCANHHSNKKRNEAASLLYLLQQCAVPTKDATLECTFDGSGSKTIVVIQGGPGLEYDYLQYGLGSLTSKYRLFYYNRRGIGNSTGSASGYTITTAMDEINYIKSYLGESKIHILSHSFGGIIAMQYAINYPQNVASLTLVETSGSDFSYWNSFVVNLINRPNFSLSKEQSLNSTAVSATTTAKSSPTEANLNASKTALTDYYNYVFQFYLDNPTHVSALGLTYSGNTLTNEFDVSNEIFASLPLTFDSSTGAATGSFNFTSDLSKITAPVNLFHCQADVIPISDAITVKSSLTSASKVSMTSGNCSTHFPFVEDPTEFFSPVETFLDSI